MQVRPLTSFRVQVEVAIYLVVANHGRGNCGHERCRCNNNNRVQCQACSKLGEIAIKCYYRFDQSI